MVADNITTMGQATGTYRHEQLGHEGVINELGTKLDAYSTSVVDNANPSQKSLLRKLSYVYFGKNIDKLTPAQKSTLGQEYIANISETASKYPTLFAQLKLYIKQVLRKAGVPNSVIQNISDREIQALISKVEKKQSAAKQETTQSLQIDFAMDKAIQQAEDIELTYNDKGEHLAPNGKPSNLTELQSKIVRTDAFKNWFGDWETLANQNKGKGNLLTLQNKLDYAKQGNQLQRLSQESEQGRNESGRINAVATIIAEAVHSTIKEKQGISNPNAYGKTKQLEQEALQKYAEENGLLVELPSEEKDTNEGGNESHIYINNDNSKYTKVTVPNNYNSWLELLDSIAIHNSENPHTKYTITGFTTNKDGDFAIVVEQNKIEGTPSPLYKIHQDLLSKGYELSGEYGDGRYIHKGLGIVLEDVKEDNVHTDKIGNLFYIDTDYYPYDKQRGGNVKVNDTFVSQKADENSVSKVVDKNGEPLVVYHATNEDFNKFDKRKSRGGFFFAPNKARLKVYNKSKTIQVFLNIKNPSHEIFKNNPSELKPKGYDGIMDYGYAERINENLYEIIGFHPNQIKLADGTNTTFDPNTNDIRLSKTIDNENTRKEKNG